MVTSDPTLSSLVYCERPGKENSRCKLHWKWWFPWKWFGKGYSSPFLTGSVENYDSIDIGGNTDNDPGESL